MLIRKNPGPDGTYFTGDEPTGHMAINGPIGSYELTTNGDLVYTRPSTTLPYSHDVFLTQRGPDGLLLTTDDITLQLNNINRFVNPTLGLKVEDYIAWLEFAQPTGTWYVRTCSTSGTSNCAAPTETQLSNNSSPYLYSNVIASKLGTLEIPLVTQHTTIQNPQLVAASPQGPVVLGNLSYGASFVDRPIQFVSNEFIISRRDISGSTALPPGTKILLAHALNPNSIANPSLLFESKNGDRFSQVAFAKKAHGLPYAVVSVTNTSSLKPASTILYANSPSSDQQKVRVFTPAPGSSSPPEVRNLELSLDGKHLTAVVTHAWGGTSLHYFRCTR
jgi:hypothetical protein